MSTESRDFAELLEQLGAGLAARRNPPLPRRPCRRNAGTGTRRVDGTQRGSRRRYRAGRPRRLRPSPGAADRRRRSGGPGGAGEDALDAALAMSMAAGGADVRTAGNLSAYGHLHVDGRQSATAARAHAVVTERTVLVAFGLGKARNALARVQSVAALSADQVWVVVDAGRKHEDTARWVGVLAAQLNVTAVAVVGAAETGTPETRQRPGTARGLDRRRPGRAGLRRGRTGRDRPTLRRGEG